MADKEKEIMAAIVNPETGEILDYIYSGDKVVHKKDKKLTDTYIFDFNKDKDFVKVYSGVNKLKRKLTDKEFVVAMQMSDYVCYKDCILRTGGHLNGGILSIIRLSELIGVEVHNLRKIINTLMRKGIVNIIQIEDINHKLVKAVIVNPYIYSRGTTVKKEVVSYFDNWKNIMDQPVNLSGDK